MENQSITRYRKLMKDFEKLLKDPKANEAELKKLSEKLKFQNSIMNEVSIDLVNKEIEKLEKARLVIKGNTTLSDEQYISELKKNQKAINNLKSVITEKKLYEKNSKIIVAAIAGDYSLIEKRQKRRRIGLVAAIGGLTILAIGAVHHFKTRDNKTGLTNPSFMLSDNADDDTPDNNDDLNNTTDDDIPEDTNKNIDDSKDDLEEDNSKDVAKNDESDSKNNKSTKDESDSKDSKSTKEDNTNTNNNGGSGSGSSSTTDGNSTSTTDTTNTQGNSSTTVVPEDPKNIIPEVENGELPIEPSTEDQTKDNIPIITPGKTEEDKTSDTETPAVDDKIITDTGNDSEITHDIDDDSKDAEPEGVKPDKKSDSHTDEKSETIIPAEDDKNITDTGNDSEITHDIDDDSKDAEPEGVKPDKKEDTEEKNDVDTEIPELTDDNIVDTGNDSEKIIDDSCKEETTFTTSFTPDIISTPSDEYQIIGETKDYYIIDTGNDSEQTINNNQNDSEFNQEEMTVGETVTINYDPTTGDYVYEESDTEIPELTDDNIIDTENIVSTTTHGALTLSY